jgi:hypothetical protein
MANRLLFGNSWQTKNKTLELASKPEWKWVFFSALETEQTVLSHTHHYLYC